MRDSFNQINTLIYHVVVSIQSVFGPHLYLVLGILNSAEEFIELRQSMS